MISSHRVWFLRWCNRMMFRYSDLHIPYVRFVLFHNLLRICDFCMHNNFWCKKLNKRQIRIIIQWNLPIADTYRVGEVSAIQRFPQKGFVLIPLVPSKWLRYSEVSAIEYVRYSEVSVIQHVRHWEVLLLQQTYTRVRAHARTHARTHAHARTHTHTHTRARARAHTNI